MQYAITLNKTPSSKNDECEVECECNECFMTFPNAALLLSKAEYSSKRAMNYNPIDQYDVAFYAV